VDIAKSNKKRYLMVLRGEIPDRVPIFESVINKRYIKYKIGRDNYKTTLEMPPEELVPMAEQIPLDMVMVGHFCYPRGTLNTWDRIKNFVFPDIKGFLNRVDSFINFLKDREIGLVVYVHGPLDTTYLSMGYQSFFLATKDEPKMVEAVMDLFTEHSLELIKELIKRDIDVLQIVDDVAMKSGSFINPKQQNDLWIPKMRKLVEPVINANIPLQFHSDGSVDVFMDTIIDLGFVAVNPIDPTCNDIREVKKKYGNRITLMGNMDIAGSLAFGKPDDVRKEMKSLLKVMMPGGRYIAMSGSSISNGVVPENYDAMVDAVLKYGRY